MTVHVEFHCGGCNAVAKGTASIRKTFVGITGKNYGFGAPQYANTIEDVCPPDWCAYDPWTYCTYCPECWAYVSGETDVVLLNEEGE